MPVLVHGRRRALKIDIGVGGGCDDGGGGGAKYNNM